MNDTEYQKRLAKIDLFDEAVYLTRFQENGRPGSCREISPVDLAAAFANQDIVSPILPPNTILWTRKDGVDRFVIYLPPAVPTLIAADTSERQPLAVPIPGLIWIAAGSTHKCYAVKQRPTRLTERLFMAPLANVNGDQGRVCWGNVRPGKDPVKAITQFFEADFSGHWANECSKKYPDNVIDHWRELSQAEAADYPLDDLVKTKMKLGDVL